MKYRTRTPRRAAAQCLNPESAPSSPSTGAKSVAVTSKNLIPPRPSVDQEDSRPLVGPRRATSSHHEPLTHAPSPAYPEQRRRDVRGVRALTCRETVDVSVVHGGTVTAGIERP